MDGLTQEFEQHRRHLTSVAYRMLGSSADAEDAVQEAWLRLSRSDSAAVANLGGWLTTVVARVCLDMLRARRARGTEPLLEPVVSIDDGPEEQALLADSVGVALLVVLETLTPAERLAFVLHDMFAVPFSEIGTANMSCSTKASRSAGVSVRSEEHTSELQSHRDLVCPL